jgi:predicted HicB family RNase H-like nuclease
MAVRTDRETKDELEKMAKSEQRSLNNYINKIFKEHIEKKQAK